MLFSVIRIHKSKDPLTNLHMFTHIHRSQGSAVITLGDGQGGIVVLFSTGAASIPALQPIQATT